ncbi:membrane protein [Methylococcaceae bacterium]|nr:membrane protein [Methylococcaceae bacterium]
MKEKIKKLLNNFLIGIFAVIPIVLVIQILFFVKDLLSDVVRFVYSYSDNTIYTILFLILSFVVLVSIGHKIAVEGRVWFITIIDVAIEKIPFLNTIYRVLKKVISMFSSSNKQFAKEVVYVEYPKDGIWVPAYVTNRFESKYVLFIPTSPNPTSGFTVVVDKAKVLKSNMNIEEASSFIVSIGVDYDKITELNNLP